MVGAMVAGEKAVGGKGMVVRAVMDLAGGAVEVEMEAAAREPEEMGRVVAARVQAAIWAVVEQAVVATALVE